MAGGAACSARPGAETPWPSPRGVRMRETATPEGKSMSGHNSENGQPPPDGSILWAWVGEAKGEIGMARLQTAWIPLGTINLVGFSREVMADPQLIEALQQQANK